MLLISLPIFMDAMSFGLFTGLIGLSFFMTGSAMITYSVK